MLPDWVTFANSEEPHNVVAWMAVDYRLPLVLVDLVGIQQDPEYHPEGDAWQHTLWAVWAASLIDERDSLNEEERHVLRFAALLHDVGKVTTTQYVDGRYMSHGHAEAGGPMATGFLLSIGAPTWLIERVVPLVENHMDHLHLPRKRRPVTRLARRLGSATLQDYVRLVEADQSGRPPRPWASPAADLLAVDITY